jgi:hypothetical protein
MKPSLRQVLADSHIAAIAILVLLFWCLDSLFQALWLPLLPTIYTLSNALEIRGIPSSPQFTFAGHLWTIASSVFALDAVIDVVAAWLLSHWVYGQGPLHLLHTYGTKLSGGNHA